MHESVLEQAPQTSVRKHNSREFSHKQKILNGES